VSLNILSGGGKKLHQTCKAGGTNEDPVLDTQIGPHFCIDLVSLLERKCAHKFFSSLALRESKTFTSSI
jgi:hypothetical protein